MFTLISVQGSIAMRTLLLAAILSSLVLIAAGCQKETVNYGGVDAPDEPVIEYTVEVDANHTPSS